MRSWCQRSGVREAVSEKRCQRSGVREAVSEKRCQRSGVREAVSEKRCQRSGVREAVSEKRYLPVRRHRAGGRGTFRVCRRVLDSEIQKWRTAMSSMRVGGAVSRRSVLSGGFGMLALSRVTDAGRVCVALDGARTESPRCRTVAGRCGGAAGHPAVGATRSGRGRQRHAGVRDRAVPRYRDRRGELDRVAVVHRRRLRHAASRRPRPDRPRARPGLRLSGGHGRGPARRMPPSTH